VLIEALEQRLASPGGPFDPGLLAGHDRAGTLPREACRLLYDAGLHLACVPVRHGGRLTDFFGLIQGIRLVARRDLSVAVAHGQLMLGTAPVWVAGDDEQAAALAAEIAAGAVISFGLTEREHGSDVLANSTHAVRTPAGWRLTGEKWPVNYGTHGDLICVFARTEEGTPGSRAYSLFLVDKRTLPPSQLRFLPKTPTYGLRGADISGVVFTGAEIPARALVGRRGDGVGIALRSLQLTRVGCAGLSLGAADHAVALALSAAAGWTRYQRVLLGRAVAGLLAAEAAAAVAARSLHCAPGEMSVISAVVKSFVPAVAGEVIALAGELLGAGAFRDAHGEYAKLERDHRIVEIFDGSTYVNRNLLINHFPVLARSWQRGAGDHAAVRAAAALGTPLPEFDARRLRLLSAQGCGVVQTLPSAAAGLLGGPAGESLLAAAGALHLELAAVRPAARDVPPEAFDLARRYELLFAAAACVHVHLASPVPSGWLDTVLAYLHPGPSAEDAYLAAAAAVLAGQVLSPPGLDPTGWGR
jgi:alkylation response protein AidB-like acyl-CoA dehydrogenase